MIRLKRIAIREVRGIRELDLSPEGKSFVIFGPNGSGKSGVVDAVEFALTGDISRLKGPGTAEVSVAKHGPHVLKRDDADESLVELQLELTDISRDVTITRYVTKPGELTVVPDDEDVREALAEIASHPEIVLSRREIIKFVVAEPGLRSKEIQALLRLDRVGSIRGVLKTTQNKASSAAREAERASEDAESALARHLDLAELDRAELLKQVNVQRGVLGLALMEELTDESQLDFGAVLGAVGSQFDKASALRDIDALVKMLTDLEVVPASVVEVLGVCGEVAEASDILAELPMRPFVERGLELVVSNSCPLCELSWESQEHLEDHLRAKVQRSDRAQALLDRLKNAADDLVVEADAARSAVAHVEPIATWAGNGAARELMSEWSTDLVEFAASLQTIEGATASVGRLEGGWMDWPSDLLSTIAALRKSVELAPDLTDKAAAQSFLAKAQERWANLIRRSAEQGKAHNLRMTTSLAYKAYCTESEEVLRSLYDEVEQAFTSYYRTINSDDESSFKAKFNPQEGKLDLKVDFYGHGMFPPAAYHSEGHQDGMGVCLYLALMKRLLGDRFTFALLDDVVMSVDAGHRKQFCELLRTNFAGTQFLITTHDKAWARQMRYQGLVSTKTTAQFHGWSVETGPIYEHETDVWEKIAEDAESDDVPSAAGRLRRHLEFVATELAETLGARVRYRADADYDLGELLSSVIGRHKEIIDLARKSAVHWKDVHAQDTVEKMGDRRKAALAQQSVEQWIVNKAIHYNDWAEFELADFEPAVDALRDLIELFRCAACGEGLYLSGPRTNPEAFRCRCASTNLNLVK